LEQEVVPFALAVVVDVPERFSYILPFWVLDMSA
jgi:hypothetical protein